MNKAEKWAMIRWLKSNPEVRDAYYNGVKVK